MNSETLIIKYLKIILITLIFITAIVLILFFIFIIGYKEKIYPQTFIEKANLSNLTLKNGLTKLTLEKEKLETTKINLVKENFVQETTLPELGIELLLDKTLVKAYNSKRSEFLKGILIFWKEEKLTWEYNIDQEKFTKVINEYFSEFINESQDASLSIKNGDVIVIPEKNGQTVNSANLANDIVRAILNENLTVNVEMNIEKANLNQQFLEENLAKIKSVVKDHKITANHISLDIPKDKVITWIKYDDQELNLNTEQIIEYLKTISSQVSQKPQNATVRFNNNTNKLEASTPSREGLDLMVEETARRISSNILEGKNSTDMFIAITKSNVDSENLDSLGITTLLGTGESDFRGSSASRVENINVAANKISGYLIAPDQEFSFVTRLGAVNASTGYVPELVIKGNQTIPEYGGGVCQVSTTLFRAALNSSLDITERQNHSYIVPYYGTPGLDATIYIPKPDFKFKNTTNNYILIQHYIVGTKIYYQIYGAPQSKTSKIIGPITLSSNKDGSRKTVAYREIYENGQLLRKDEFFSNYRPPNKVVTNPLQ